MPLYTLVKDNNPHVGDSGRMSDMYLVETDSQGNQSMRLVADSPPLVGGVIRVGTPFARSYTTQDYWQTSLITEILSDETDGDTRRIKFRTLNSIYTWSCIE